MRNGLNHGTNDHHLTEHQVAIRLDVPRHGVLPLAASGKLHPVAMGGLLLYRRTEVDGLRERLAKETATRSSE
jgi:hypothetical protein